MMYLAPLLSLIALLALAWLLTRRWWLRDADVEQLQGLLVLLLVAASIVVTTVMIAADGWSPAVRAAWSLGIIVLALAAASTNWTRQSVRWTGVLALLLVALMIMDIGRHQLALDPAARGVEELEGMVAALNALDEPAKARPAELDAARTKAASDLAAAIRVIRKANPRLASPAKDLRKHLVAGLSEDVRSDLKAVEAAYHPTTATPAETELHEAAVNAATAAEAAKPDRTLVEQAIEAACAVAVRSGVDPEALSETVPCAEATNGDTLEVSLATVRLRLAAYRQAVLGRDEDAEAVTTQTAALADAQTRAGDLGESDTSIVEAFRRGGEAIVADLPGQRDDFPLSIEVLGWTLLAALVLAGWRVVERRSGQQMAGPVTISPGAAEPVSAAPAVAAELTTGSPTAAKSMTESTTASKSTTEAPPDSKTDGAEAQRTAFRIALLRNLHEPTVAPGADAISSITDLAELNVGTAGLAKVANAVKGIITKPGGFVVSSDVLAPRGKSDPWTVLVRISDQTTGSQLAVELVTADTASAACRAAGYWAAADVLSRSSRIPGWAGWDVDAAESLAAFDDADRLSLRDLEKALARAPTSGLLLNELGDCYEFDGRHLDALGLYARATSIYPRYFVCRYRMAMSLGIVRNDVEKLWFSAPLSKRLSVTGELNRACKRLKLDSSNPLNGGGLEELPGMNDPKAAAAILRSLTLRLLDRLEADTSRVQLLARTLRRSERVIWWPRVWSIPRLFGSAARDEWLVRSARLLENDWDIDTVRSRASNPRSWWQLSYNLACYHARRGEAEEAERWLEVALERPGCGQMGGGWLTKDPDLQSLHGSPRFEWVVAQVSTN